MSDAAGLAGNAQKAKEEQYLTAVVRHERGLPSAATINEAAISLEITPSVKDFEEPSVKYSPLVLRQAEMHCCVKRPFWPPSDSEQEVKPFTTCSSERCHSSDCGERISRQKVLLEKREYQRQGSKRIKEKLSKGPLRVRSRSTFPGFRSLELEKVEGGAMARRWTSLENEVGGPIRSKIMMSIRNKVNRTNLLNSITYEHIEGKQASRVKLNSSIDPSWVTTPQCFTSLSSIKASHSEGQDYGACDACSFCDDICDDGTCVVCLKKRERICTVYRKKLGAGNRRRLRAENLQKLTRQVLVTMKFNATFTPCEIKRHNSDKDCWVVAHGLIYDATPFLACHPAGPDCILRKAGCDVSRDYDFHTQNAKANAWSSLKIGSVIPCRGCPETKISMAESCAITSAFQHIFNVIVKSYHTIRGLS